MLEGLKVADRFPQSTDRNKKPKQGTLSETSDATRKARSFEDNNAGWRGPWAAPPSSEETPQETLIPKGLAAPPSRVRS